MFTSLKAMDFSNNHIGGSIPSTLPVSLQNLYVSHFPTRKSPLFSYSTSCITIFTFSQVSFR
jgi:hypothetical protein